MSAPASMTLAEALRWALTRITYENRGDYFAVAERALAERDELVAEMLAALQGLVAVVNVRIDDPRCASFDAARAAIAKAVKS